MSAADALELARRSGVKVDRLGNRLAVTGAPATVNQLVPLLALHKAEILELLADRSDAGWVTCAGCHHFLINRERPWSGIGKCAVTATDAMRDLPRYCYSRTTGHSHE